MSKFIIRCASCVDAFNDKCGKVLSYLVPISVTLLFWEVIARYLFHSPTIWIHQTVTFIFGGFGILAGATVLLRARHVKVEIVWSRFSPRQRAIIDLVTSVFFFLFIAVFFWFSLKAGWWSLSIREHSFTPWSPPVYPYKMMIPVAVFLILIQGVSKAIHDLAVVFELKEGQK